MNDNNEATEKKAIEMLRATAVRAAMVEVVGENRAEIVRRARAKLVAMGVPVEQAEAEVRDEP